MPSTAALAVSADAQDQDDSTLEEGSARAAEYRTRAGGGTRDEGDLSDDASDSSGLSSGDEVVHREDLDVQLFPATRSLLSSRSLARLDGAQPDHHVHAREMRPTEQQPGGREHVHDEVRIFL